MEKIVWSPMICVLVGLMLISPSYAAIHHEKKNTSSFVTCGTQTYGYSLYDPTMFLEEMQVNRISKELQSNARLIFQSLRDAPSQDDPDYEDFLLNYHKYFELYTMNTDGSHVQRVTNNKYCEDQPDVSPDGKKIVMGLHTSPESDLLATDPRWEIAIIDIDGSNLTKLTNNDYLDIGAHWNHDGTKIVYLSDSAHRTTDDIYNGVPIQLDAYAMNADGSEKTRLTFAEPNEAYADPSFSFNEPSKILYVHDENLADGINWDLHMMDANGDNKILVRQHDSELKAINDPMFSPDGTTIIFEAEMEPDSYGHVIYNMFTVNSIGANLLKITQGDDGESDGLVQYSPNGTQIAYMTVTWHGADNGTFGIRVANADGSGEKHISSYPWESSPSWVPLGGLPPAKPSVEGPARGSINTEYTYNAVTTDPGDDSIYYLFDWGDNTTSGWLGPYSSGGICEAVHIWTEKGAYSIKVKAQDEDRLESEWSDPLLVAMPKSFDDSFHPFIWQLFKWLLSTIFTITT